MQGRLNRFIATAGGIGYLPIAPGTWAALFSVFFWFLIENFFSGSIYLQLALVISSLISGIYCSGKMINEWGKDPKQIVIDEVAGMWIALLFIPFTLLNFCVAFILFRFFDILKPLGIRKAESAKGGLGIMLDDVLAGVYSNLILHLFLRMKLW